MKISVVWHNPIPLRGDARDLIDTFDTDQLPDEPGVYVFARRFASKITAIYIGKGEVLRVRIRQQLNNNLLMRALDDAPNGERVLICGTFAGRRGARIGKWLNLVEEALITHFTEQQHDLINKRGTLLQVDEIDFEGSRLVTRATGRSLRVPKRRRGLLA